MNETKLSRYFDMLNEGELYPIYTCDSWTIPEEGTKIWCTGWERRPTIKPSGDGYHVDVNGNCYHCDQLMDILTRCEKEGYTWGIEGVYPSREQQISGRWTPVAIKEGV